MVVDISCSSLESTDSNSGNNNPDIPSRPGDEWNNERNNDRIRTNTVASENVGIAKKETAYVNRMRAVVVIVLLASTIGVAMSVYYYTKNSETTEFETQFNDDTLKVLEETGSAFERTLSLLDIFATDIVSYARASNQSWPFVTIPDFAIKAGKLRTVMLGLGVFFMPLVNPSQLKDWEEYAWANKDWANETLMLQARDINYFGPIAPKPEPSREVFGSAGEVVTSNVTRLIMPDWQKYPLASSRPNYNYDWLSASFGYDLVKARLDNRKAGMTETYLLPDPNDPMEVAENAEWASWNKDYLRPDEEPNEPVFDLYYPIVDKVDSIQAVDENFDINKYDVVGAITNVIYWREIIRNILPPGRRGIVVVIESPCNPTFTYQLDGPTTKYLGRGDNHDPKYDYLKISSSFFDLKSFYKTASKYSGVEFEEEQCPITLNVYPSDTMKSDFTTNNPAIFTAIAVLIFVFASIVFLLYDFNVERRQKLVLTSAVKSNAIVSSLFPSNVREKILNEQNPDSTTMSKARGSLPHSMFGAKQTEGETFQHNDSSKPLADMYPETTIVFADIAGFTGWSSVREPHQVFTLLETLFGAFDKCARTRKVFKVETIGDCYVAVTGLPIPNENHAVAMCKFAMDCIQKTVKITGMLEKTLGPGTANLKLRVGLNSGPTMAGVLRGYKSRFQLFGDTVNTAARMESTGIPGRIQASTKTAELLIKVGKDSWVTERSELVDAKGKGKMKTFWIWPKSSGTSSHTPSSDDQTNIDVEDNNSNNHTYNNDDELHEVAIGRLVGWNVDIFQELLKKIVAKRGEVAGTISNHTNKTSSVEFKMPLDEITDVIALTELQSSSSTGSNIHVRELSPSVKNQVHDFVTSLAFMYKGNAFHNFEHASNVVMSTLKLLEKMRVPIIEKDRTVGSVNTGGELLDPLTQLAMVFAAMIHDADHPGLSNNELVQQQTNPMAILYNNRCVAEQNSFDVSWNLLMQSNFTELRQAMFVNDTDLYHFRQVVINAVMITDIFDKDLQSRNHSRWDTVFGNNERRRQQQQQQCGVSVDCINQQATVILEDIIVASDIIHTMQHWNVYQHWNKKLFQEMYMAYKLGHSTKDPSECWYEDEILFFDQYVIPLAKRFDQCYNDFGFTDGNDFLECAKNNRFEWEIRGKEITNELFTEANTAWRND